ncbi:serine/threonine protein kinase [Candidatus Micrarchaeota archaeon]|nr:serine/threonine protein kinase [Candidatus Micrarchaeota archaeon]
MQSPSRLHTSLAKTIASGDSVSPRPSGPPPRFIFKPTMDAPLIVDIRHPIGAGGLSVVYPARVLCSNRKLAVKHLKPELRGNQFAVQGFVREAKILDHLNRELARLYPGTDSNPRPIPQSYGLIELNGHLFSVLELLDGSDLTYHLPHLSTRETVALGIETLDALELIHALGVLHHDLKPSNVFLHGPGGHPKILDFGVSRFAQDREVPATIEGTPAYLAPERANCEPGSRLSDLYSFGVMLYEQITGRLPFIPTASEENAANLQLVSMHLHEPPAFASVYNPLLPDALVKLVSGLLAKNPNDRPATAAAVKRELEGILPEISQPD